MDFQRMKTFEAVASLMSFNRAAQILCCTQSTVSAQIKALEEELGARVFERLGRHISLTPAGEELLRQTRRFLSYEQSLRAAVLKKGETAGLLSLRAPQSVAELHLPKILGRFCKAFPLVGFDIANCGYFNLPAELGAGEIDACFILSMPLEAASLRCEKVWEEPLAFVAAPSSELASRAKLSLPDLAGRTLLVAKHDCAYRMELQQEMTEARIEPRAVIELNSLESVARCASEGMGIALLPEASVSAEMRAETLVKLRFRKPRRACLYFFRHNDKPLKGAFGAFVAAVDAHFKALRKH